MLGISTVENPCMCLHSEPEHPCSCPWHYVSRMSLRVSVLAKTSRARPSVKHRERGFLDSSALETDWLHVYPLREDSLEGIGVHPAERLNREKSSWLASDRLRVSSG